MLVYELRTHANEAIWEAVRYFHPSFVGSWRNEKPQGNRLGFTSRQEWMGFLSRIISNYERRTGLSITGPATQLAHYKSKRLISLRDALVLNTRV